MQAKDVMTTDVVTANPGDPVRLAAERMAERRVTCSISCFGVTRARRSSSKRMRALPGTP